jgi:hypothetical protein
MYFCSMFYYFCTVVWFVVCLVTIDFVAVVVRMFCFLSMSRAVARSIYLASMSSSLSLASGVSVFYVLSGIVVFYFGI